MLRPELKNKGNSIYRKIVQLENLRFENIAHVSPGASVARLTAGPPLLYLMLLLVHVGINPLAQPEPFLWIGFIWVVLGGIMIAFASVRSRHRLWSTLFKDAGSGGTPVARFYWRPPAGCCSPFHSC
ncbi:MAG: hypothetical protein IPL71_24300 [Anaerolineales bacterium]|uniref:hypothetical protein n=1 Tax=Candidatus Villigracilis proximus TaxID=3140683 RepID=UPI0031348840|nr:hypothetical protein [Anaerolineales bacterium]